MYPKINKSHIDTNKNEKCILCGCETFTHKIRRLTTDAEGNPGVVTYGTTTNTDDESIVTYSFVLGKYVGKIPNLVFTAVVSRLDSHWTKNI